MVLRRAPDLGRRRRAARDVRRRALWPGTSRLRHPTVLCRLSRVVARRRCRPRPPDVASVFRRLASWYSRRRNVGTTLCVRRSQRARADRVVPTARSGWGERRGERPPGEPVLRRSSRHRGAADRHRCLRRNSARPSNSRQQRRFAAKHSTGARKQGGVLCRPVSATKDRIAGRSDPPLRRLRRPRG